MTQIRKAVDGSTPRRGVVPTGGAGMTDRGEEDG
jgi:hypothetical protein